jgi:hypothetical protein
VRGTALFNAVGPLGALRSISRVGPSYQPDFKAKDAQTRALETLRRHISVGNRCSKRGVVEPGLRTLIELKQQERIRGFRDKLPWTGIWST